MRIKSTYLALLAVLLSPMAANADPITRYFEFSSTSGPLLFGPTIGSFEYDDSIAPVGGGYVLETGLFSALSVSFGGFTFDETTANSGWIQFDALGGLLEAHFGNLCVAGSCTIGGGEYWWIRVGVPDFSVNDFSYSGYNGAEGIYRTRDNRLLSVPEPGTLALLGIGLFGMGLARRRKV